MVHVDCPLCGRSEYRQWAEEAGFTAVKCAGCGCGLVYVNPRPDPDEITEANICGQHRTETGTLEVVFRRKASRIGRYRRAIRSIFDGRLDGKSIAWLDVGAGFGELVEAVQGIVAPDSRIEGIEPMVRKARHAQARGLQVRACTLSDVHARYDVVSLINVFSHIPDFRGFLAQVRARLTPGGEILIQTGNGGDLAGPNQYPDLFYLPDHLVFAGIEHMKRFLAEGGFEVLKIRAGRVDGMVNAGRNVAYRMLGKPTHLFWPYRSPFRTVLYRAAIQ